MDTRSTSPQREDFLYNALRRLAHTQVTGKHAGSVDIAYVLGGHTVVRVGDTVFDNFRPGGIPYAEFVADLGGSAFFGTQFVKVVERAF